MCVFGVEINTCLVSVFSFLLSLFVSLSVSLSLSFFLLLSHSLSPALHASPTLAHVFPHFLTFIRPFLQLLITRRLLHHVEY